MKHDGGNIMFWECFFVSDPQRLLRVQVRINVQKKKMLEENLMQSARNMSIGKIYVFSARHWPLNCMSSIAHHQVHTIPLWSIVVGGSIMMWGCFSAAGPKSLLWVEVRMNAAKYWEISLETWCSLTRNPNLWRRSFF